MRATSRSERLIHLLRRLLFDLFSVVVFALFHRGLSQTAHCSFLASFLGPFLRPSLILGNVHFVFDSMFESSERPASSRAAVADFAPYPYLPAVDAG